MSSPQELFDAAVAWIKDPANKLSKDVPNERKLCLYKYFKQVKEGDVQGSQPWAVQIESRAKWDAWNSVKGMSKDDAMTKYAEEVEAQKKDFA